MPATSWTDLLGNGKIVEVVASVLERAGFAIAKRRMDRIDIQTEKVRKIEGAKGDIEAIKVLAEGYKDIFGENTILEFREGRLIPRPELNQYQSELTDRTSARLRAQEERRQANVEGIAMQASELIDESALPVNEVDPDWTAQFLNGAKDVSDSEMQKIWAQLLAGEIRKPGSFSRRTIEVVRTLSPSEAKLFSEIASYILFSENNTFIFREAARESLDYNKVMVLKECGLMMDEATVTIQDRANNPLIMTIGDIMFQFTRMSQGESKVMLYMLTTAGKELANLITVKYSMEYLRSLARTMRRTGVEVLYSKIISKKGDAIETDGDPRPFI